MNAKSTQFLSLIQTEIDQLQVLFNLMINEKESIENNQIDALDEITRNKQVVLDSIEVASRKRSEFLLAAAQAATEQERLLKFLESCPAPDRNILEGKFNALEIILNQCKEQNNINAMIISMNQRHIERNMNILKGIDDNSMTYTNKGTTQAAQEKLSGVKA